MELKNKHIEKFLDFAIKTVKKSNHITLKYFNKKLKHKLKDNLSPVTIADLKSENFIINSIKEKFPGHSIFAEESGKNSNQSEFKWIIDPIDGTKNFMRKIPFWGTLLALEYQNEIVVGVISIPALKEFIFASKNNGCYCNGKRTKVSKTKSLSDAYLLHGCLYNIFSEPYKSNFVNLVNSVFYDRGFGDCHGHSLVIKGFADAMLDPYVMPYDVAPVKICIEESGGVFTDLQGNNSIYSGNAVVSNGKIHDQILKILNENLESRDITKE